MTHTEKNKATTKQSIAAAPTTQSKGGVALPPPPLALKKTAPEPETQEQESFMDSKIMAAPPAPPTENNSNISSFQLNTSTAPIQKKKSAVTQPFSPPTSASSNSLPNAVRGKMEGAFQADFSNVKIHQNSSEATGLGAQAFARGNDVHFAPGKFNPNSSQGQELIGHELTHIIQQRKGMVKPTIQAKGVAINDNPALERQADEMGRKAAQGIPVVQQKSNNSASISTTNIVQRQTRSDHHPDIPKKKESEKKSSTVEAKVATPTTSPVTPTPPAEPKANPKTLSGPQSLKPQNSSTPNQSIATNQSTPVRVETNSSPVISTPATTLETDTQTLSTQAQDTTVGKASVSEPEQTTTSEPQPIKVGDTEISVGEQLNQQAQIENPDFDANATRQELYAAMKGGVTGEGTDEEAIYKALDNLSPKELEAVKAMYFEDHGVSLEKDIQGEMTSWTSDLDLNRANALLSGDQMTADAIGVKQAINGWTSGNDKNAIFDTLRNLPDDKRAEFEKAYESQFNETLSAAMEGQFEGYDLDRANALIKGETNTADAIALQQAMDGNGTNEQQIEDTYAQIRRDVEADSTLSTAQVEEEITRRNKAVETSFNEQFGNQYDAKDGQTTLKTAFASEMSEAQLDLANALADNKRTEVDVARLKMTSNDAEINEILEGQYNRALSETKRDEWSGIQSELNDLAKAEGWDAYKLQDETRKREVDLEQRARTKSTQYMSDLESKYNASGRNLESDVTWRTTGQSDKKARDLLRQGGYLSPVQQIEHAVDGAGTDEDTIKEVFAGKTQEEIEAIRTEWNGIHGEGNLDARLKSELDGRDEFDVDMLMKGLPKNQEQELENMRTQFNWEKKNAGTDTVELDIAEKRLQGAEALHEAMKGDDLSPKDRALAKDYFHQRGDDVGTSIEGHRQQLDAVTDAVATGAAITTGVVATVASGGTLGPVALAALAAGASTAASTGVQYALKGEALGGQEALKNVGVEAVSTIAGAGTGRVLGKFVAPALKGTTPGVVRNAVVDRAGEVVESTASSVAGTLAAGEKVTATGLATDVGLDMVAGTVTNAATRNANQPKFTSPQHINALPKATGGGSQETNLGKSLFDEKGVRIDPTSKEDLDLITSDPNQQSRINELSQEIQNEGDRSGERTEAIAKLVHQQDGFEHYGGAESNNGFDNTFVKRNDNGDIIGVHIDESKFSANFDSSGVGLNRANPQTNLPTQMSDEWIAHVATRMYNKSFGDGSGTPTPEDLKLREISEFIMNNPESISKSVTAVNPKDGTINVLRLNDSIDE